MRCISGGGDDLRCIHSTVIHWSVDLSFIDDTFLRYGTVTVGWLPKLSIWYFGGLFVTAVAWLTAAGRTSYLAADWQLRRGNGVAAFTAYSHPVGVPATYGWKFSLADYSSNAAACWLFSDRLRLHAGYSMTADLAEGFWRNTYPVTTAFYSDCPSWCHWPHWPHSQWWGLILTSCLFSVVKSIHSEEVTETLPGLTGMGMLLWLLIQWYILFWYLYQPESYNESIRLSRNCGYLKKLLSIQWHSFCVCVSVIYRLFKFIVIKLYQRWKHFCRE